MNDTTTAQLHESQAASEPSADQTNAAVAEVVEAPNERRRKRPERKRPTNAEAQDMRDEIARLDERSKAYEELLNEEVTRNTRLVWLSTLAVPASVGAGYLLAHL